MGKEGEPTATSGVTNVLPLVVRLASTVDLVASVDTMPMLGTAGEIKVMNNLPKWQY